MSLILDTATDERRKRLLRTTLSAARLLSVIKLELTLTLRRPLFWTWIALIALMSWASS